MLKKLVPSITRYFSNPDLYKFSIYKRYGGYKQIERALTMDRESIIDMIKRSGLRGRGGAGFPTYIKWSSVSTNKRYPHYLIVNADESEPGTCKDIPIIIHNPHLLLEGILIASYAINSNVAYIYLRGEAVLAMRRLDQAIQDCYDNKIIGKSILNTDINIDIRIHMGAGAYICGEETALLESLEGKRGQPRMKIPLPVISGLYNSPTLINNVESIASVPIILERSPQWFNKLGTIDSKGFCLFSISGHVINPGQYEAEFGITFKELLNIAGGIRYGHRLKFWTPGGSSTPILTDKDINIPLSFEDVSKAGSMIGTRALQVFDETVCVVRAILRWSEFYRNESCGKCTPCREGTGWIVDILREIESGNGTESEISKLESISNNIFGNVFCALGDGASMLVISSIKKFKDEYLLHIRDKKCPFDIRESSIFKVDEYA